MFAPAMMPVTAGKNSANIVSAFSPPVNDGRALAARSAGSNCGMAPAKNDAIDATRIARMKYWTRMVQPAPM